MYSPICIISVHNCWQWTFWFSVLFMDFGSIISLEM